MRLELIPAPDFSSADLVIPSISTEGLELASENLTEDEIWSLRFQDRREFVDSYSEDAVKQQFVAYINRLAKRRLVPIYILKYPHRSWIRKMRRGVRYGGGSKVAGGWWRAVIVLPTHIAFYKKWDIPGAHHATRISLWFNPSTSRWRTG